MLANSYSKFIAPIIIAGMMIVWNVPLHIVKRLLSLVMTQKNHCCSNLPLQKMEIDASSSILEWIFL